MRVLLTGAAGFIGSAVAEALTADGHEVIGVDAFIPQAHDPTTPHPPGIRVADVRDAKNWRQLLRGVDAVCHQAAMVGSGLDAADLPAYAGHNDLGTACLLAAMYAEAVPRLVLASSMVVYGEGDYTCPRHGEVRPGPRSRADLEAGRFDPTCPACGAALDWAPVGEEAPVNPRSSYAASKVAQEHYAASWARQTGGGVAALRYHNVYGPGMPRDTPYSGVAAIFRSALESGRSPRVFEDGAQMRDFVHVSDVAAANLAALRHLTAGEAPEFAPYNICSGSPVSILAVARALVGSSAIEPEVTGEFRAGDVRHVVASPDRAREVLGFRAEVAPEVGLQRFAGEPLR